MPQEQGKYNKNRLLALGVLILLVLILLFLVWWWFIPKAATPQGPTPTATEPAQGTTVLTPQVPTSTEPVARQYAPIPGETEVRALARNFTERYGSWSTDSNFQNLKDLFPRVTTRLQNAFQRTMDSATPAMEFKSVETRVMQITINSLTDAKADILVTAQQVTRDAALQETTAFVKLALTMVKEGQFWYVDRAEWRQ